MAIEQVGAHGIQPQVDRTDLVSEARSAGTNAARPERRGDEVAISAAAKELAQMSQAVADAPDVREDRIAALQQAIDSGVYEVPIEALAKKMLGQRAGG